TRCAWSCLADLSGSAFLSNGSCTFLFAFRDWILWPDTGALAQSRRAFAQHEFAAGNRKWISSGIRVRVRLDSMHRPDFDGHIAAGFAKPNHHHCNSSACNLLGGTGDSILADCRWHRTIFEVLPTLPKISARRRTV